MREPTASRGGTKTKRMGALAKQWDGLDKTITVSLGRERTLLCTAQRPPPVQPPVASLQRVSWEGSPPPSCDSLPARDGAQDPSHHPPPHGVLSLATQAFAWALAPQHPLEPAAPPGLRMTQKESRGREDHV